MTRAGPWPLLGKLESNRAAVLAVATTPDHTRGDGGGGGGGG